MDHFEEDMHYVLDTLHKMAFSSLTKDDITQLTGAVNCVSIIRDTCALAQELIWILEDHPWVSHFDVQFDGLTGSPSITHLVADDFEEQERMTIANLLVERLARVTGLCDHPKELAGWSMRANRSELSDHIDSPSFNAIEVLRLASPGWLDHLVGKIDEVTSQEKVIHSSRQALRAVI